MDTESLQIISSSNTWTAILPELVLGCVAVILLFIDLLLPAARRYLVHISMTIQLVLALILGWHLIGLGEPSSRVLFGGLLRQNEQTELMRIFFLISSVFVTHLGGIYLAKRPLARVEFFHLTLVVTAALMLFVQSHHFVLFFVSLETLTIGLYILIAYGRHSRYSLEAGLKYLIMGAFSSAILLFGIVLLYGVAGNPNLPGAASDPFDFAQLAHFIGESNLAHTNAENLMVTLGAVMVLIGVAFKIGAVPFQIWVPDVYQGAPTPVTALLAVSSKAAGFFALYVLLNGPFAALESLYIPLLTVITGLTLLFGNIAALGQQNVKRVMGMSGVAHAGILLMGVLASLEVSWGFAAVFFYLVVYGLASFGVFEVMAHVAPEEDSAQEMERFDDLMKTHPFMGSVLLTGLGSLAGIPPLAGFIAKLLIFIAAFQAGFYGLLGIALLGVVISIYYYFSWMRTAVMKNPFIEEADRPVVAVPATGARLLMSVTTALTIFFGIYQGFFF